MKKTTAILASAVALVMAGSAAAETTVYGNIRLELINQSDLNMDSSKLVTGFKSSQDLGNGMTGFMRLELEHDDANVKTNGWDNDLSYVGLKGDFGSVTMGVQNDAAGFACGGTDIFVKKTGEACGAGAVNGELENALVYANKFGDVTFVVGKVVQGSAASEPTLIAVKYDGGNFTVGAQITDPDTAADNMSVIGGTFTVNDIQFGLTLADNGASNNNDALAFAVKMPLGGGTFKIGIDQGDAIVDSTHVGYDYSLSKSVYTGVEFNSKDISNSDDMVAVWLGYKF